MMNKPYVLHFFLIVAFCLLLAIGCTIYDGDDDDDDEDEKEDNEKEPTPEPYYYVEPANNPSPPWPEWPLKHWVWEDESTQESAESLVEDYMRNDVPVGAIIIDSPWATGYNTFQFDPALFPDAQGMIDDFHDLDVKVFLWVTPVVNIDSPNYEEGLINGYYINDGRLLKWWKGYGSFIDYTNPDAVAWWHSMMDQVLEMGIDGWKTDNAPFGLWSWIVLQTQSGPMSVKEYQRLYYSDFYNYTRDKAGDDRLITARPVDAFGFQLYGLTFAPREVNFAGWVGDQDPTWKGLNEALVNMFLSAEEGYVNFGSDIAGYRGDGARDKKLFLRWAQLGAFCPIMENGGQGEHRPWTYDEETLDIYRKFTNIHHNLVPYLYSQGAESYQKGVSLMRQQEGGWNYLLGNNIFVSAIWSPDDMLKIQFPPGTWMDFWKTSTEYDGMTTQEITYSLDEYPVFVRKGSIVPMDLGANSVFENPSEEESAPITVAIYTSDQGSSEFDLYEENGTGARITAWFNDNMEIKLSSTKRKFAFRIIGRIPPAAVIIDGQGLLDQAGSVELLKQMESGWYYDKSKETSWIKTANAQKGLLITVR